MKGDGVDAQTHLTAMELSERLRVSKGSVYKLAKSGKIPSYAVGPKLTGLRFDLDEVLAVLRRPVREDSGDVNSER